MSYLDYAGLGRVREPARAAMADALDLLAGGSETIGRLFPARHRARALAARLLDCREDEVGFVPNTSTGLHLVADGIDWRDGDEVVVLDREFPANVRPWRERGVRLVWVPLRDNGYRVEDVAAAVTARTRLVAVSHVHYATGATLDLDDVVAAAGGAMVCVDAVQSLGATTVSARSGVDFIVAGAHKWLCAPPGTGVLFCRRDRLDELRLPAGWAGYAGANDLFDGPGRLRYDLAPKPSAARVEGGMYNVLGMVGLAATLDDLLATGVDVVAARVRLLAATVRASLREAGFEVADGGAGVVGFRHARVPSGELVDRLLAAGHQVAHPDGWVRAAPHHWTADDELAEFLASATRLVS